MATRFNGGDRQAPRHHMARAVRRRPRNARGPGATHRLSDPRRLFGRSQAGGAGIRLAGERGEIVTASSRRPATRASDARTCAFLRQAAARRGTHGRASIGAAEETDQRRNDHPGTGDLAGGTQMGARGKMDRRRSEDRGPHASPHLAIAGSHARKRIGCWLLLRRRT